VSYSPRIGAIVTRIGAELGMQWALDADDVLELRYVDGHTCILAADADRRILMSTPLAAIHLANRSVLFETALRLNANPGAVQSGLIGFDPVRSQLEFSRSIATEEFEFHAVITDLAEFLHTAVALRTTLEDALRPAGPKRMNGPGTARPGALA
jgi:hypothetical protein